MIVLLIVLALRIEPASQGWAIPALVMAGQHNALACE